MRLNRLVFVSASVGAIAVVSLSCGPTSQKPQVVDAGYLNTDGSKPFPPPPIEIEPGGDLSIQWTRGTPTKLEKVDGETGTMITDELTWKVTTFVVKEKANNQTHTNVNWVSLNSAGTEVALIRKIGSQLQWRIDGDTPPICSKHDKGVPKCAGHGIPKILFDIQGFTMTAEWVENGTPATGEIAWLKFQPRTCPPY